MLGRHGFQQEQDEVGAASGGLFATVTFRRGRLAVELIVRRRNQLGCPNYTAGAGYAGHADLVAALGAGGREQLIPKAETFVYQARDNSDPFRALETDLTNIVLPVLEMSEPDLIDAVQRAVAVHQQSLGF